MMLSDSGPRFPFCICWANENWSRRWDGSEHEILIAQTYNEQSALVFIEDILPILEDSRHIRVENAPLLLVYRVGEFKDAVGVTRLWRRAARERGIERLHLCAVQSFGISDPRHYGFDSAVDFSPRHVGRMLVDSKKLHGVSPDFEGYLDDYISVAMQGINHPPVDYVQYRGLFPRWDNTARRGNKGHVFINDSRKLMDSGCGIWCARRCSGEHSRSRSSSLTPGTNGRKGHIWSPTKPTAARCSR
jgi:hypothetical protein